MAWMIALQLGRRNLTPEQKGYLRGTRYTLEKGTRGGDQKSKSQNQTLIRDTLAEEYGVAPSTISADAEFAEAVDTLEDQVRADIHETVLRRKGKGKDKVTKKQATRAGKLVQTRQVEPLPCMRRESWKSSQVLEAIDILGTLPQRSMPPEQKSSLRGPHAPAAW